MCAPTEKEEKSLPIVLPSGWAVIKGSINKLSKKEERKEREREMIFAGWERFFGVMGGSSIGGCSGSVFRERIKRNLRNKNKVLKNSRFLCVPYFAF